MRRNILQKDKTLRQPPIGPQHHQNSEFAALPGGILSRFVITSFWSEFCHKHTVAWLHRCGTHILEQEKIPSQNLDLEKLSKYTTDNSWRKNTLPKFGLRKIIVVVLIHKCGTLISWQEKVPSQNLDLEKLANYSNENWWRKNTLPKFGLRKIIK